MTAAAPIVRFCRDCHAALRDPAGASRTSDLMFDAWADGRCPTCWRYRDAWECEPCGGRLLVATEAARARHAAQKEGVHARQVELTERARDGWTPVMGPALVACRDGSHLAMEDGVAVRYGGTAAVFVRTEECDSVALRLRGRPTATLLGVLVAASRMVAAHGVPWRKAWAQVRAEARCDPPYLAWLCGAGPGDRLLPQPNPTTRG